MFVGNIKKGKPGMKFKPVATLAIAGLALTACSSGSDQQEGSQEAPETPTTANSPTEPVTAGPGTYQATTQEGAELEFELPTSTDHDALQDIAEYRDAVHATDPVEYVVVDVDNRNGSESIGLPAVTVYDEAGNTYEFESITGHIDKIQPETDWESEGMPEVSTLVDGTEIPESEGTELSNRGNDIHNQHTDNIEPAERGEVVLVYEGDELSDEFTRVATYPHGTMLDPVEAWPAELGGDPNAQ